MEAAHREAAMDAQVGVRALDKSPPWSVLVHLMAPLVAAAAVQQREWVRGMSQPLQQRILTVL